MKAKINYYGRRPVLKKKIQGRYFVEYLILACLAIWKRGNKILRVKLLAKLTSVNLLNCTVVGKFIVAKFLNAQVHV